MQQLICLRSCVRVGRMIGRQTDAATAAGAIEDAAAPPFLLITESRLWRLLRIYVLSLTLALGCCHQITIIVSLPPPVCVPRYISLYTSGPFDRHL